MQRLVGSGAVRLLYGSLGIEGLKAGLTQGEKMDIRYTFHITI
jgi:hypothetical protein